jgi:hypothetical protein
MRKHNQLKFNAKLVLSLFGYNVVFLLLTFCTRLLSGNSSFKFHKVFSSFSGDVLLTGVLGREILLFIGAQLLLHFFLAGLIFFVVVSLGKIFKFKRKMFFALGRYLTLFSFLFILLKNAELYPYSFFARFFNDFIQTAFGLGLTTSLQIAFGVLLVFSFFSQIVIVLRQANSFRTIMLAGVLVGCLGFFLINQVERSEAVWQHSGGKPNIFIIGVDSLRPDHISYLGYSRLTTPNIDDFLKNSIVFPQTITPLGRTFPSWVSLLTGQYPKSNGARFNLIGKNQLRFEKTLGDIFRENGYTTIYGSDEKRFANIDDSYGFDFVLGPPMGAADFLLGTLGDLPLSNLIVNTTLGKTLLPFSHGNRAADITYNPKIFSQNIEKFLDREFENPLFFALHFCLPHYPYRWNGDEDEIVAGELPGSLYARIIDSYDKSIHAADRQFKDFLDLLNKKNLLENSIVILISDHGESFSGTSGDLFFDQVNGTLAHEVSEQLPLKKKSGHGSSLLGYSQNRCILAFRDYRRKGFLSKTFFERVSLVDVAPTLLDYLGMDNDFPKRDGVSLKPFLTGQGGQKNIERTIFLETGFNPTEGELNVSEMIKKGLQFYRIDANDGLLSLKDEHLPELIKRKERAAFKGDFYLVLSEAYGKNLALALNLKTSRWTSDIDFIKKEEPFKEMLSDMLSLYGDEIGWINKKPN